MTDETSEVLISYPCLRFKDIANEAGSTSVCLLRANMFRFGTYLQHTFGVLFPRTFAIFATECLFEAGSTETFSSGDEPKQILSQASTV